MSENYEHIQHLASMDAEALEKKGETYGSSWKRRGGVGAFMMMARKWDRLENIASRFGWDIFRAVQEDRDEVDGVLDDIRDLRRYLLLVESELTAPTTKNRPKRPEVAYFDTDESQVE